MKSVWPPAFAGLLATLLLIAAFLRIHTYVTAQDPFWYIALARQHLDGRVALDVLAPGLSFVAPGFPLLLAGLMVLFGPYAPYWLNLVLGGGVMALLSALARPLVKRPVDVIPMVLLALWLSLAGAPFNAHFLLYPFRGMPTYFLIFLGYLALRPTTAGAEPRLPVLAGLVFLLALTIRETAVFGLGGALLLLLVCRKWKAATWVLAPAGLSAAGYFLVTAALGRASHHQLRSWTSILLGRSPGESFALARDNLVQMYYFFLEAAGWWGLPLLALGLWQGRRIPAVWCLFFLPALAMALFYSLYQAHYRYFLSVLILLAPILGLGALWLIDQASVRLRRPAARPVLIAALSAALVTAAVYTIRDLQPWGRLVHRTDIRRLQASIDHAVPPGSPAYLESTCRYLADALVCFSSLILPNPQTIRNALDQGRACLYFEPLNEAAHFESYLRGRLPSGMTTRAILDFYGDLQPVPAGALTFAEGKFQLHRVVPWSQTEYHRPLDLDPSANTTFWLDFGERPPGSLVRASLVSRDGVALHAWPPVPGRHIMGFAVPADKLLTGQAAIQVAADHPLPRELLIGVATGKRAMSFDLGVARRLSTHYWFAPPFPAPRSADKYVTHLASRGRLALPVPVGDAYGALEVLLAWQPAQPQSGRTATLRCRQGDTVLSEQSVRLDGDWIYQAVRAPRPPGDGPLVLDLELDASPAAPLWLKKLTLLPVDWRSP